jgi:hypothetical protein
MDLRLYVEDIHRQFAAAAEAGGDDARALAERLAAPLDAALRLALQDALAAAAEEITLELAPGSVELRLRGRDPEFVVTPPPAAGPPGGPASETGTGAADVPGDWPATAAEAAAAPGPGEDSAMARINLRMPEHLKAQVEQAAGGEGLSVNAWLVRAAAAAVDRVGTGPRRASRSPRGSQRFTGWVR